MSEQIAKVCDSIKFVDEGIPAGAKTHVFRVETIVDLVDATVEPIILGSVKWFGRWRCYSYFPNDQTVYEEQCLRDIAAFCEEHTELHMNARAQICCAGTAPHTACGYVWYTTHPSVRTSIDKISGGGR